MVKSGKIQKKSFFEVSSTLTATKIYLYGADVQELDGRIVKIDLTRSLRGKSLELKLKVRVDGKELIGEPIGLELAGSYIRRAFRKGADYVEDSFVTECKDAKVLIKPFMLTRNKVSRSVRKRLRDVAKSHLMGYLETRDAKEIFTEIITNKIQKELSLKLKKIYPLALCEIRIFEILAKGYSARVGEMKGEQKLIEEKRDVNAVSKVEYLKDKSEKKEKAREEEKKDKDSMERKKEKKALKKEKAEKKSD